MSVKNIITRLFISLLAILFGVSHGSGLFCMYADFFGPKYPNPDEQNILTGYLLAFNAITILVSLWGSHFIYNRFRCKQQGKYLH